MTTDVLTRTEKKCAKCKRVLPVASFARCRTTLQSKCRECVSEYNREYRLLNLDRLAEANRVYVKGAGRRSRHDYTLRRLYGITVDDYDRILAEQGGCCAICRRPDSGSSRTSVFHVDHCHRTGVVRGLLCSPCNRALGLLGDDEEAAWRMAVYLGRRRVD